MTPEARPRLTSPTVASLLINGGVLDQVALLGVRGYYRATMGLPGVNDRGIYDDALFLHSPAYFASFNANTDPSTHRKGIAVLQPGLWRYRIGIHGLSRPKAEQYKALVQAAPVTVHRDEVGLDTGWFGINVHRGGYATTSSLGCQTIVPPQWPAFIASVEDQLKRHGQKSVPYLLIDGPVI